MGIPDQPTPSILLSERLRYTGKKYTFVSQHLRFPGGKEGEREYFLHPGAGMVVPVTTEGHFMLLKQYRFAVGSYIYEFPAGTLEPGEVADETIRRELEEETGYRSHRWDSLGSFFLCPGYSDEVMQVYLARDLEKLDNPPPQDDDEDIEVIILSASDTEKLLLHQSDLDAKTIAAFYRAQALLAQES